MPLRFGCAHIVASENTNNLAASVKLDEEPLIEVL